MSPTKKEILDAISNMSVTNLVELTRMMEKRFKVSSSHLEPSRDVTPNQPQQTEFDVVLRAVGARKIAVIKTVRSVTALGLKEAKNLVESAPVSIKTKLSQNEAKSIQTQLENAGASVQIK